MEQTVLEISFLDEYGHPTLHEFTFIGPDISFKISLYMDSRLIEWTEFIRLVENNINAFIPYNEGGTDIFKVEHNNGVITFTIKQVSQSMFTDMTILVTREDYLAQYRKAFRVRFG